MNENQAHTAANIIMAAAALGAAVFILRNPKLRRMAWQLARQYATGPLAVWSTATVRNAWDASGAITSRDVIVVEQGSPRARIGPVA
jgi:hypothetical protein